MPFQSEAQRRACWATGGFHGAIDCHAWAHATPKGKKLPKRKGPVGNRRRYAANSITKIKATRTRLKEQGSKASPLRADPTRTGTLRAAFVKELRRRFAVLKGRVVKVVLDDAFGLEPTHNFNPDQPRDEHGRWLGGIGQAIAAGKAAAVGAGKHLFDKLPDAIKVPAVALTKAAYAGYIAGNKAVRAVAQERGYSQEQIDRLARLCSSVDFTAGGGRAAAAAAALGMPALAAPAAMVPWGSVGWLAYSTVRDPLATLQAAKGAVAKVKGIPAAVGRVAATLGDRLVGAGLGVNSFCPTGEGGGVDPTCSPNEQVVGGSSAGEVNEKLAKTGWVLKEGYQEQWVNKGMAKVVMVPIKDLVPMKGEPLEGVEEAVPQKIASIKHDWEEGYKHFVLDGSRVTHGEHDGRVQLSDGRHRAVAARSAGRTHVPVIVGNVFSTPMINSEHDDARLIADALDQHGHSEWYTALLYAGLDEEPTAFGAVGLANGAWEDGPTENCATGQLRDATSGRCGPGVGVDVPRDKMPQIKGDDLKEFVRWARNQGVGVANDVWAVGDLRPTQREFRQERVDALPPGRLPPVIASSDGYVLDGTHRWVKAWQEDKPTIGVLMIGLPLDDALDLMRRFPKAKFVANAAVPPGDWKPLRDAKKVEAFQQWLQEEFKETLTGADSEALWHAYAEAGYRKGAGRAFDDANKGGKALGYLDDTAETFYQGGRDAFLRSAFGRPVVRERIEMLAGRSFDDLENVTDDLSTRLSRSLTDGLVEGSSPREIAREMADDLDLSRSRAEVIARTEIIRAHADGQLMALQNLGVEQVGVQVEFSSTGDGRVCPECESLQGTVMSLEDAAGVIPVHPNCRCAWVPALPALPDEEKEQQQEKEEPEEPTRNELTWAEVVNAFCPTGPGGGQDNSCPPHHGGGIKSPKQLIHDAIVKAVAGGDIKSWEQLRKDLRDQAEAIIGDPTGPLYKEARDAIRETLGVPYFPLNGGIPGVVVSKAGAAIEAAEAQQAPTPAAPATPEPPTALGIPTPSEMKFVQELKGASKPKLMEDEQGNKWVVKTDSNVDRLKNEADADAAYRALGIKTAPQGMVVMDDDGSQHKVTAWVEGSQTLKDWEKGKTDAEVKGMYEKIGKGFAADALLANWDVVGAYETNKTNILVGKDGEPYRIDNGGALRYHGAGTPKGDKFADTVGELKTLRDPNVNPSTAELFGHLTDAQVKEQVKELVGKREDVLKAVTDPITKQTLGKRFDHLEAMVKDDVSPTKAAEAVASASTPHAVAATPSPHTIGDFIGTAMAATSAGNPLHTAAGLIQHIWDNKGSTPFTPLLLAKIHALNPNGVEDGVLKVSSLSKSLPSDKAKLDSLQGMLPVGTVIKSGDMKESHLVEKYGKSPKGLKTIEELHQYLGTSPGGKEPSPVTTTAPPVKAVPPSTGTVGDYTADKAKWDGLGLPQVTTHAATGEKRIGFELDHFKVAENKDWAASLTHGESAAVKFWKGGGQSDIRKQVREGNTGSTAKAFLAAIAKAPDYAGVTYRGINGPWALGEAQKLQVGGVYSDPSPHCTSINAERGHSFAHGDVLFRLVTKTAKPIMASDGYSTEGHGGASAEKEIVGQPGVKYRVMAINKDVTTSDKHNGTHTMYGTQTKVKYLIDLMEI